MKHFISIIYFILFAFLTGCAGQPQFSDAAMQEKTATGVEVKPSEAGRAMTPSVEYIRIKMERSIFLDPPEQNNDVYLRVRDTSGRDWGLPIQELVAQQITRNGFNIVNNASNAAYALNVNILFADEASAAEIAKLDETKYGQNISGIIGTALAGAAILAGTVALGGGDSTAVAAGAAAGAVAGGVASALRGNEREKLLKAQQETKFFSLIADIEVRERAKVSGKKESSQAFRSVQSSGSDADLADDRDGGGERIARTETETFSEETNWKRYRTRLIGKAKGKLVVFKDVQHDFATKMAKSIGGLF